MIVLDELMSKSKNVDRCAKRQFGQIHVEVLQGLPTRSAEEDCRPQFGKRELLAGSVALGCLAGELREPLTERQVPIAAIGKIGEGLDKDCGRPSSDVDLARPGIHLIPKCELRVAASDRGGEGRGANRSRKVAQQIGQRPFNESDARADEFGNRRLEAGEVEPPNSLSGAEKVFKEGPGRSEIEVSA